jgi:hypothetical protein
MKRRTNRTQSTGLAVLTAYPLLLACAEFSPSVKHPTDNWWCLGGDIPGVAAGAYVCFDTEALMLAEKSKLEEQGNKITIAARPAQ